MTVRAFGPDGVTELSWGRAGFSPGSGLTLLGCSVMCRLKCYIKLWLTFYL